MKKVGETKMKINYRNDKISVEIEGETQRDLFAQLGAFQEVFDETTCRQVWIKQCQARCSSS